MKVVDGREHGKLTLVAVPIVFIITGIIGLLFDIPVEAAIVGAIGCLAGLIIDPDLDQEMITSSEWRVVKFLALDWIKNKILRIVTFPIRIAGLFLAGVWVGAWFPYAFIMPHRGFLSHFPFVSTFLRLVYILVIINLFGLIYSLIVGIEFFILFPHLDILWVFFFLGLGISDITHYGRDKWGWHVN